MAWLNNLVVSGDSRFLGKVYINDIDVAGTTSFTNLSASAITSTGTLSVAGTSAFSGIATFSNVVNATAFKAGINGLYINNKQAIYTDSASDTWLRINAASTPPFSSGVNFGNSIVCTNTELRVGSDGQYFKSNSSGTTIASAAITMATIDNGKVTGDFIVNGVLRTNQFEKSIIRAIGGNLYVSPTFEATENTSIICTAVSASTVSFTITDSGITGLVYGGANWYNGSKIKFTASITGNVAVTDPPEVIFSSAEGTLTSNMNATATKLSFTVNLSNANTYFKTSSTALTYTELSVMMYQIKSGNNYYPIGIYIKSYGENKSSYVDVYGGTTTVPTARLGLLNGLKDPENVNQDLVINGETVSGWGLMTSYGYFKGKIVSASGKIGGWTIGTNTLTNNNLGQDNSMWLTTADVTATKFAGAASALTTWRIAAGSKFGVTSDGTLYASNLQASGGKIGGWTIGASSIYSSTHSAYNTAVAGIYIGQDYISMGSGGVTYFNSSGTGKIGPWTLSTTYIRNGSIANATNTTVAGVYLGTDGLNISNGTAATTSYITKSAVNIGNKLTWNGSTLSVTGTVNASSGEIGGWTIGTNALTTNNTTDNYYVMFADGSNENNDVIVIRTGAGTTNDPYTYPFFLRADGTFSASSATITGEINADTGTFGGSNGFVIASGKIYSNSKSTTTSTNNGVYVGNDGIYLGAYSSSLNSCPFQVTNAGVLTSTSGTIGGWTIEDGRFYSSSGSATIELVNTKKLTSFQNVGVKISLNNGTNIRLTDSGLEQSFGDADYQYVSILTAGSFGLSKSVNGGSEVHHIGIDGMSGEIRSSAANTIRFTNSNYATIFRQDGTHFWILHTNENNQYSSYNSHRPFSIAHATGLVRVGHGLVASGGGDIWSGDATDTAENHNGARSAAGNIYMYSQGTSTGNMGLHCSRGSIIAINSSSELIIEKKLVSTNGLMQLGATSLSVSPEILAINQYNNVKMVTTNGNAGLYHENTSGSSTAKWMFYIGTNGTVTANTSDVRYKNIYGKTTQDEALALLTGVDVINFTFKEDTSGTIQNGFKAQQVRDILIDNGIGYRPYLIIEHTENDDTDLIYDINTPETDDIIYSLDYSKFTPILWKGWQIHNDEITLLKKEISKLKAEIRKLKGR